MKKILEELKNIRKAHILQSVYAGNGSTRSELCSRTGISKNYMTFLVNQLLHDGFLENIETSRLQGSGRSAAELRLRPDLFYTLGLNLSMNFPSIALLDASRKVVEEVRLINQGKYPALVYEIRQKCNYLIRKVGLDNIACVGIAVPGIIDYEKGILIHSHAFEEKEFSLAELFSKEFGRDIFLINSSHILPFMEKNFGSAGTLETFLTVDEGLGLGMYLQGRLYRGWQQRGGELGYIKISDNPVTGCDGRKGLLINSALFPLIGRQVLDVIRNGGKIDIKWTGKKDECIPPESIVEAVEKGNQFVAGLLAQVFSDIGDAAVNLAYLFNPQAIYLPGWTRRVKPCTVDVVKRKMEKYGLREWGLKTEIFSMSCPLTRRAEAAAVYAMENFFEKQIPGGNELKKLTDKKN